MNEIDRISAEYEQRDATKEIAEYWEGPSPRLHCLRVQRVRAIVRMLARVHRELGQSLGTLEIGVGRGGFMQDLVDAHAGIGNITGVDLSESRIEDARSLHPTWSLIQGDAQHLPFEDSTFDLVIQSTMYSSVLDSRVRGEIGREVCRVLVPGGFFLSYDMRPYTPTLRLYYALAERVVKPLKSMRSVGRGAQGPPVGVAAKGDAQPGRRFERLTASEIVDTKSGMQIVAKRATSLPVDIGDCSTSLRRRISDALEATRVLNTHMLILAKKHK